MEIGIDCKFSSTYKALAECQKHIDAPLSGEEHTYRMKLIKLCRSIAKDFEAYSDCDLQELQDDEPSDDSNAKKKGMPCGQPHNRYSR